MTFQLTAEGTPQYALNYDGKKVILPSDLGFELRGVLKAQKLIYNAKEATLLPTDSDSSFSAASAKSDADIERERKASAANAERLKESELG